MRNTRDGIACARAVDGAAAGIRDRHGPVKGSSHPAISQAGGCRGDVAGRDHGRQLDAIDAGDGYVACSAAGVNGIDASSLSHPAGRPVEGRLPRPRNERSHGGGRTCANYADQRRAERENAPGRVVNAAAKPSRGENSPSPRIYFPTQSLLRIRALTAHRNRRHIHSL